ncbi:cyclic nucleotide-binding/CBS domain-containing protein [Noviherbaspirillum sp.]|uniref:CBS domain-containing protein n=1 Tax=Noviherbaspirillum sp. TaxID=1926288 RepID=UPI002B45AD56|nr:CBS domain-containing protein [Noviherbaspirillum sp.]HJV80489.1 CBS domain-containing protein [Noviherbaspirillum sp.]
MSKPISSIMHRVVSPASMDDSVEEVEAQMQTHQVSSAPVYDSDGVVLGILTATDLLRFHASGRDAKTVKAWEICTYRPIEVAPDASIAEVAELMLAHKIHHVVVMQGRSMVGIVSSLDIVRLFLDRNMT